MTELFVDNEEQEKTAKSLPVDKAEWPLAIEEQLISQEPYLTNFDINIDLKKVDEQSQVGFGNVTVVHNEKEIDIPVVIDGGEIKPFDVMIHNGDTMPLTKDRVNQIFTEYNFAEEVTDKMPNRRGDNSGDLTDEGGYLPDEGLYATNSKGSTTTQKISSFLDAIDGKVYKEDIEKLASRLDDDELAKFSENGTSEVVKKAFNLDTKSPNTTWKSIKQDDVILCKEQSPNKVEVTKTPRNSELADTKTVTHKEAETLIKDAGYDPDKLNNLSPQNDIAFTPYNGVESSLNNESLKVKEASAKEGSYIAKTASGNEKQGVVIDNLFDFDMNKVARSVFISSDEYSLQNKFVKKEASQEIDPDLDVVEPTEGDTGVYIKTGSSDYWATVPFDIEKQATIDGQTVQYIRPFGSMNKIAAVSSPDLKRVTKVAEPKGELKTAADEVYFVPDDMNFIKLSKEIDLPKNLEEIPENMKKESGRVYQNDDGTYHVDINHDYDNHELEKLSDAGVQFVLGNHGIKNENIKSIIKTAENEEFASFSGINQPESFEKVSNKIDTIQNELKQSAKELKNINVKLAANLKDKNSVDSILALALVNEENIDQFINKVDEYEDVIADLSEMLLLARLGSNTLPEKQVKDAMKNLEKVVDKIREIELIID